MSEPVLHKGWTEPLLREGLRLAPPRAQDILHYIASHGPCTSTEIADGARLKSERAVGPNLHQFTRAVEHLGVRAADGQFHWPIDFTGRRGNHDIYDMKPAVRAVVLDVLGHA